MNGKIKARDGKAGSKAARSNVNHPREAFEHPAHVVADSALSKDEKVRVLESLEQDARQMATASGEGMEGGERTNLRDVLLAKTALDLPASEAAFAIVLQTFESKLADTRGTDTHTLISQAIDAIIAAREAINRTNEAPAVPPGAAKPGSKQELDEELAKERLDP